LAQERKKRGSSERIRAPPLPQQQPQQHPQYEDDEKFWQMYRNERKPLKYPRECVNFNFGPLADYGKEGGDDFIRYTTVSVLSLFKATLHVIATIFESKPSTNLIKMRSA
jgi:hypothetical protein